MAIEDYFGELGEFKKKEKNGKHDGGWVQCRHAPTLICSLEGVQIYGASKSKVSYEELARVKADLLVNLTGYSVYSRNKILKAGRRWASLQRHFEQDRVEEIIIDWPDMGVINAGRQFWADFFQLLKQNGYKNVVFFCIGGHGRTGTAVGSLMTVALDIHGGKAIKAIRSGYCKKAIESRTQEDYVRRMTSARHPEAGEQKQGGGR
ncbi:MAG TPA: hypothetical protein VNL14_16530 [Candidatus Acidoferrales bacterium]|nr:hypothetical protein [Candidatus Acidoferrales bacterium]